MSSGYNPVGDPEVVASILGSHDLRAGLCARMNPTIWSGEWCDTAARGEKAREELRNTRGRAVALCKVCPVLAACEAQLVEFEDANCRVTGVMAARMYGQRPAAERVVTCHGCHRTMHIRPHGVPAPILPEGHVLSQCRGLCSTCYSAAKKAGTLDQIADPPRPGNHRSTQHAKGTAA